MMPCGLKCGCCKRCKHLIYCDGGKIAFTAATRSDCPDFEDDGSNQCELCPVR